MLKLLIFMVKTLVFDKEFRAKEIKRDFEFKRRLLYWTQMTSSDEEVKNILVKKLGRSKYFVDDLLEKQRPGVVKEGEYDVIVLSFPSKKGKVLQITFLLSKNKIITITNRESKTINTLFKELLSQKVRVTGVTNIFSIIIDNIVEKSILYLEELEEQLEKKEIRILKGNGNKNTLKYANETKEKLFFISKMLRGDGEVIREILGRKVPSVNLKYFSEHTEDRMLYMMDYVDLLKETTNNNINNYIALLSHKLNERIYILTIIGSLLIIPSITASLFGMNIPLPINSFWQILGIIVVLSGITVFIIKKLKFLS